MKKTTCIIILFCSLLLCGWGADAEMRACWVSRFDGWISSDKETCENNIRLVMQTLKDNNFNAVLFQIRGECDTLYPSPYEPWAPQFSWKDPGFDPVAFAVEEAHAQGLEFHAYINTHTMASTLPPDTTTPEHVYNLYGKPGSSPNWQIHGENGLPAGATDSYYWLSPGIPDAEAWTRRAILHVVKTYNVDGVHFDRIRCPAPTYSHDPISQARFEGEGNPDKEAWGDWMRSQITRQLRNIYGAVNQINPRVKVTTAPFGICKKEPGGYQGTGTESYYSWFQDSFGWMENHVVDAIFPMIYWNIGSAHPFEVLLSDFLNHTGGRHVYSGCVTSCDYVAQIYETRRQGAPGSTIFSFKSINYASLKEGPYTEAAPIPIMPWKSNPTTGIIVGYVKHEIGDPIVDAKINRNGDTYNYLSSGDGFFSIIDVAPGTYTITATKTGLGEVKAQTTVAAGQVVQVDLIYRSSMGSVELDKSMYRIGQTVQVTLRDSDLKGATQTTIKVFSTTQPTLQDITLNGALDTGVFTGMIPLHGGAQPRDGMLRVSPDDIITITYHDEFDGAGASDTAVQADVDSHFLALEQMFDSNPFWNADGGWEFGAPTGQSGDSGLPDPVSGWTGANVYGYNLNGGYENNLAAPAYLTTKAIDCSGGKDTIVSFYRWLNVDKVSADKAAFEISYDGATWFPIWTNSDAAMTDSSWVYQEFNVAAYADYRPTVYLRWGMGETDASQNYSGWNIDDVRVLQTTAISTGFLIDNVDPGFSVTGFWGTSTQGIPYGSTKRFATKGDGSLSATWTFTGIPAGVYKVEFWVNDNNYAIDSHYLVEHDSAPSGGQTVIGNQNWVGDGWHNLGIFAFTKGVARISLTNYWEGVGLYVVSDAMRISIAPQTLGVWDKPAEQGWGKLMSLDDGTTIPAIEGAFHVARHITDNSSIGVAGDAQRNIYGAWEGPSGQVPYIPGALYRIQYTIRTSQTDKNKVPTCRLFSECIIDASRIVVSGGNILGKGISAPDADGETYNVYFSPPDLSSTPVSSVRPKFEVIDFDESEYGDVFLDFCQVERLSMPGKTSGTFIRKIASGDFVNWVETALPEPFGPAITGLNENGLFIETPGLMDHPAINYGAWGLREEFFTETFSPAKIYRIIYSLAVPTLEDHQTVGMIRLFNTNKGHDWQSILSLVPDYIRDHIPTVEDREYNILYEGSPKLYVDDPSTADVDEGKYNQFGYNFDVCDGRPEQMGRVILTGVEIYSYDKP